MVTSISLQLGVDVYDSKGICKYCGMVVDRLGLHSLSCMAGVDVVFRHNLVRDIIHSFCIRARLNPELEKAGILQDDSIFVNLRRLADILVHHSGRSRSRDREWVRTALDVKVINALGQTHRSCDWLVQFDALRGFCDLLCACQISSSARLRCTL